MEGEREEEKHPCEREVSIGCLPHALPGTEPAVPGRASQGLSLILNKRSSPLELPCFSQALLLFFILLVF